MPVQDGAMGDREGGEGKMATGGEENGGEVALIPDDSCGRRHQATTNPMMATMSAVTDNDGDGG